MYNIIYIVVLCPINVVLYTIYQHILIIYLAHKIHDVSMSSSGQYIFPNILLYKLFLNVFLNSNRYIYIRLTVSEQHKICFILVQ